MKKLYHMIFTSEYLIYFANLFRTKNTHGAPRTRIHNGTIGCIQLTRRHLVRRGVQPSGGLHLQEVSINHNELDKSRQSEE